MNVFLFLECTDGIYTHPWPGPDGVGVVPSLLNVIFGLRPRHNTLKKVGFIILDIIAVLFQMSAIAFVILVDFGSSQGKT